MKRDGNFADYDVEEVYEESRAFAKDPSTSNFVVEFGREQAQIAFDLDISQFQTLISKPTPEERQLRWM
jgi:hypothetical protein